MAESIQVSAERMRKLEEFERKQAEAAAKYKRQLAKDRITIAKALKAGIEVTEKEIDAYMAAKGK